MSLLIILFYLFFLAILLLVLFFLVWGWWSFAPWLPASKKDYKRIFELAGLKPNEIFYDLGCGTGTVVLYANKIYQARAIGLEIVLPLFLICKIRQLFNPGSKIIFKLKNLYNEDLSSADVIYFFGTPKTVNSQLKYKLEKEAKKGTRIISYVFQIKDWSPLVIDKPTASDKPIYLYIK